MKKNAIIMVYFGKLPAYFNHFLISCLSNPKINWFFFTDRQKLDYYGENIFYNYLNINNFNKLASEKLGFPVEISNPYKLCDFKPAYGCIFEDYLKGYDFWGYCDSDIIFGRISKFLTEKILEHYDIISSYSGFLSGPFCLFKNNRFTKNLFEDCPNYQQYFQNHDHLAFDENIGRKALEGLYLKKFIYFIIYVFKNFLSFKNYSYNITEFRYQFHWYYKRKNIMKNNPADMTEVVFEAVMRKEIKACFNHLIFSDHFFKRIGRRNWKIKWKSGILTDMQSGNEIFAFHFPISKSLQNFKIDLYNTENNCFIISETGITNG